MNPRFIAWDAEWIFERFDDAPTIKDLAEEYNKAHGTEICYRTFKGFCQRNGLMKCKLTKEQDTFIRENYSTMGVKRLAEAFNEKFHTHKTYEQMRRLACNRKLTIADDEVYNACRHDRGCKYEIGDRTIGWQEPYVKVGENKFVHADRYDWEQAYGKLPKDYRVIHLDGNRGNHNLDNLQAIPLAYSAKLMRNKLYSHRPEITKGAIMLFELQEKIERTRQWQTRD